jgi:hypothetical protein
MYVLFVFPVPFVPTVQRYCIVRERCGVDM